MNYIIGVFMLALTLDGNALPSQSQTSVKPESIASSTLQNFQNNSPEVKKLIELSLSLARNDITYLYGSADPKAKGMDCSGTIYYLLNQINQHQVPRSSYLIYNWVREKGNFHSVTRYDFNSPEFKDLKPGDLLFWSGTYQTGYIPNVSHVMIYIGIDGEGRHLMTGASNGRTYKGRRIYGVSVFDFVFPGNGSTTRFLGYSCIPEVTC